MFLSRPHQILPFWLNMANIMSPAEFSSYMVYTSQANIHAEKVRLFGWHTIMEGHLLGHPNYCMQQPPCLQVRLAHTANQWLASMSMISTV